MSVPSYSPIGSARLFAFISLYRPLYPSTRFSLLPLLISPVHDARCRWCPSDVLVSSIEATVLGIQEAPGYHRVPSARRSNHAILNGFTSSFGVVVTWDKTLTRIT